MTCAPWPCCWHNDTTRTNECCRCSALRILPIQTGMVIMVANATGVRVGILAERFPGRIGHLYSPGTQVGPYLEISYCLDNDRWNCHLKKRAWDEAKWRNLLAWAGMSGIPPGWVLVPDVVRDRDATLREWNIWEPVVKASGFRTAFAVQDGMTFNDVPNDECMLFIGGGDDWKESAIGPWCERFPGRIHVGRVNGMPRLLKCYRAGAVSVDGTGWFHTGTNQSNDIRKFLRETTRNPCRR